MYATCSAFAPSIASQPPTEMIVTRAAETSSSTTTIARVTFDDALSRFGCSMITPGASMPMRPYNLAAVRAALVSTRTQPAGVAELVDARGLGPRGRKPWGFESLRPHSGDFPDV